MAAIAPSLYRCQKCEYAFHFPSRETWRVPKLFGGGAVTACPRCYKEALRSVGMALPVSVRAGDPDRPRALGAPDALFNDPASARAYRVNLYD